LAGPSAGGVGRLATPEGFSTIVLLLELPQPAIIAIVDVATSAMMRRTHRMEYNANLAFDSDVNNFHLQVVSGSSYEGE
jgi:hypothetical protein